MAPVQTRSSSQRAKNKFSDKKTIVKKRGINSKDKGTHINDWKTTNRKQHLGEIYSKINAEMANRSDNGNGSSSKFDGGNANNIFMDILKVAPIIELDDDEELIVEVDGYETNGNQELKSSKQPAKKKQSHKMNFLEGLQQVEMTDIAAKHELNISCTSLASDTDFRDNSTKQAENFTRRRRQYTEKPLLNNEYQSPSLPNEDKDLRYEQQGPSNQEEDHPTCSTSNNPQPIEVLPVITRGRMLNFSPCIDLTKNYRLTGLRYFQEIKGELLDRNIECRQSSFTIASFNVLCQRSMEKTLYLYRHLNRLGQRLGHWEERNPKILAELERLSSDVFCLQEIQDEHYEQVYRPYFLDHGYDGKFTPRKGIDIPDGCAIFWRISKLELLNFRDVYYNLRVNCMNRDNVGQIALLGIRGQNTSICVSNTHIHYNMKRGEVKLAQIAYLLSKMYQTENELVENRKVMTNYKHFAGHILCGDFNIFPGSLLHRFIMNGQIDLRTNTNDLAWPPNIDTVKSQNQPPIYNYLKGNLRLPSPIQLPLQQMRLSSNCTFVETDNDASTKNLFCLNHNFNLTSVYEYWNALGQPEVSTYHKDCAHPDFIFYTVANRNGGQINSDPSLNSAKKRPVPTTKENILAYENFIQLRRRLSLPTREQLDRAGGPLPNDQYGSDHLALWAEFDILCLINK